MSTSVFFFGGFKANADNMKVWLDTARAQKSKVDFNAFPYPDAGPKDKDAVAAFKQLKSVADAITKSKADLIYIVGHSSGCAIANAVDDALKDHSKIALVTLDGYVPDEKQRGRKSTQLWSAKCDDKLKALTSISSRVWPEPISRFTNRQTATIKRMNGRFISPSSTSPPVASRSHRLPRDTKNVRRTSVG